MSLETRLEQKTILDDRNVQELTQKIVESVLKHLNEEEKDIQVSEVVLACFLAASEVSAVVTALKEKNPLVT